MPPELTKAEIRGPWVVVLSCGHIAGNTTGNPGRKRRCFECRQDVTPVAAHYGKRSIPIDVLVAARRAAKDIRQQKKEAAKVTPTRGEHHRAYRANLIDEGCSVELADKATMEYRWNGLRERAGEERYRRIRERLDGPRRLSDAKYKPARVDPVLRGVGRATGETARAIRSGKTLTAWQHKGIA